MAEFVSLRDGIEDLVPDGPPEVIQDSRPIWPDNQNGASLPHVDVMDLELATRLPLLCLNRGRQPKPEETETQTQPATHSPPLFVTVARISPDAVDSDPSSQLPDDPLECST